MMAIDVDKIKKIIDAKIENALGGALSDGIVDLQRRLDSGRGTNGRRYKYSSYTAKLKGKSAPVDWTDTGTLRRSIDFDILKEQGLKKGVIGLKDVRRGNTSNVEILKKLISQFPTMWGLNAKEKQNLIKSFKRNYRK